MPETKTCPTCEKAKPLDGFYNNRSTPDGVGSYCKPCWRAYTKRNNADNPSMYRRRVKHSNLRKKYGMSVDEFEEMRANQGSACAICEKVVESVNGLGVDHDHATGAIRELLCTGCNRNLAALENSTWRMAAEAYLALHAKENA